MNENTTPEANMSWSALWLRRFLWAGVATVVAFALGGGSAWWVIERGSNLSETNGSWRFNRLAGDRVAGAYSRAQVARAAFLAMNRSEAIYYLASTDENGGPLRCDARYRIEGNNLPGRWWSITAYGSDHFLVPNEPNRHSYTMANVEREPDGSFVIHLSRSPGEGNWLPTGDGETFVLFLRIYNPHEGLQNNPTSATLPRLIKE